MTFKPLFGKITLLSLYLENFRVSHFHVSYLNHETFKLCLQNTLNMSKNDRVYFGVLQLVKVLWQHQGRKEATWEPEATMRAQYPQLFESGMNFEDEIL